MSDIEAGFDLGEFASSSRLLCAITTRGGRVLWANDTLGRAFGPEAGAVVNRPLVELLDPYDRKQATRELTRLDDRGDEVVFDARLHPVAGGFAVTWSVHVGRDGLLYLVGMEAEAPAPELHDGSVAELHDLASRDDLTGVANRRTFDQALVSQLERCHREGLPLSVALVDLDGFKQYNDTFGHLAGDDCLVGVARALQERAGRAGELVGRFGGDEFVVLWPGVDATTAHHLADAARESVAVLDLRRDDDAFRVSVSIGGVTVVPTTDTTPAELVDAADRAMYIVKRAGGNATRWVGGPDLAAVQDASG